MAYFNHAGTSWPKPPPVARAVREALEDDPRDWPRLFAEQHAAVAGALGVEDATRLLLTPGCTAALHVGIHDHGWAAGDRIVTSCWEHHALLRAVTSLEPLGVEHVTVPPAGDQPLDLAQLERALVEGSVRLVAMCAAANVTGAILPVREVIELSHRHGALVLIDAAQTAGWIDYRLDELGVDLFAFAGHKGPQAPWGVGGLYVAPHVSMASRGAARAVGERACAPMPGYCDTGSVDRIALSGLVAGLAWLAERGDRLARARGQLERITAAAPATLHGPRDATARMPTLACSFEGQTPAEVSRALAERGVIVSGGMQCAPAAHATLKTEAHGVVRLSVGPTTSDEDVTRCIEALGALR
jgi:selenocysteine lyase/cysteine desulfurase